jgi:choline dehydrogenase-like flavoprotein
VTGRYEVIIIGTGAGGTLAHTTAPSGKRILLLERGIPAGGNGEPGSGPGLRARKVHLALSGTAPAASHSSRGCTTMSAPLTAMANAIRPGEHLLERLR